MFHFNGSGPNSGDHTGVDEITKALIATFELTGGTQKLDIASTFADDHHGVVVMRETASRPDGATLDVNEVHVLAINSDGKITDLWDLPPTTQSYTTTSSTADSCGLLSRPSRLPRPAALNFGRAMQPIRADIGGRPTRLTIRLTRTARRQQGGNGRFGVAAPHVAVRQHDCT